MEIQKNDHRRHAGKYKDEILHISDGKTEEFADFLRMGFLSKTTPDRPSTPHTQDQGIPQAATTINEN
jgi:hypothetical protein